MRFVCKFCLAVWLLPLLMGASVYRWVDDNGVVNYTQMKPEGVDAVLVNAETGTSVDRQQPPAVSQPAASADDRGAETAPKLSDSQKKMLADLRAADEARQQEVDRVRDANCKQAHDLLDRLTSNGRIRIKGDDGSVRMMPEEERQKRIADAEQAAAVNCAATASR